MPFHSVHRLVSASQAAEVQNSTKSVIQLRIKPFLPLYIGKTDHEFEEGKIEPHSTPPELPDVMKAQEGSAAPSGLSSD